MLNTCNFENQVRLVIMFLHCTFTLIYFIFLTALTHQLRFQSQFIKVNLKQLTYLVISTCLLIAFLNRSSFISSLRFKKSRTDLKLSENKLKPTDRYFYFRIIVTYSLGPCQYFIAVCSNIIYSAVLKST